MSSIAHTSDSADQARLHHLFPLLLVVILPLAPPEARGEGLAGAALSVALFTALRIGPLARTWMTLALVLGAALALPAILLAEAPGAAVEPLAIWILAAAAGAASATLSPGQRRRQALFLALAATASLVSLHALYQISGFPPITVAAGTVFEFRIASLSALEQALAASPELPDRELLLARLATGRAFAAFSTPAALGGFLALSLPVTVGLGFGAASSRRRVAWLLAAAIELAGLLATASLSAAAALGAATIVACVRAPGLRRRLWMPGLIALGILAAAVALRGSEVTEASGAQHPLRLRAANFRAALEVIADHPWTGVGPGSFGEVYPQYRRTGDNETQHVHDLPLELGAEWGVPAGILGSALFFWIFLGPLLGSRHDDEPPWVRGAAVGLGALGLQGLLDFTVLLPSLLWLAAILRGFIARPGASARERSVTVAALGLASVIGAATVAGLSGVAWNARVAARELAHGGQTQQAEVLARRAARLAPWNPDGWLYLATIVAGPRPDRLDEPRLIEATQAAERAVSLSPVRPGARMTRARLRAAAGDAPGAYADAAAAARLYPLRHEYAASRDELAHRLVAALAEPP